MIIKELNKLIINPIIVLLLGSIGLLFLHKNNVSNLFNYMVIGYIFIVLTIGSTISLIKESVVNIKEFINFIYYLFF